MEEEKELNLYATYTDLVKSQVELFKEVSSIPERWETNWFYEFIPYQHNERVRLCAAVLPMMKLEVEMGVITEDMKEEIEGYYNAVIVENSFDEYLPNEEEREMVKKDLKWCYETAKKKGLID
jgi:hypothetical protein